MQLCGRARPAPVVWGGRARAAAAPAAARRQRPQPARRAARRPPAASGGPLPEDADPFGELPPPEPQPPEAEPPPRTPAAAAPLPPLDSEDEEARLARAGRPAPRAWGLRATDAYFYVNVAYWTALLGGALSGSPRLLAAAKFVHYTAAMLGISLALAMVYLYRWAADVRAQARAATAAAPLDRRALLRYSWRAMLWGGFVLWYGGDPTSWAAEVLGPAGFVMALFGLALAGSAAATTGVWSFFAPAPPARLTTAGPYALLRHPQALGNAMLLVGFAFAGGAVWAAAAFAASFLVYAATQVPAEEAMLEARFGHAYAAYKARVPRWAWALVALVGVEALLVWRFGVPAAVPPAPLLPPPPPPPPLLRLFKW